MRTTISCPNMKPEPVEGWLMVNNNKRYCRLNGETLDIAFDDKLQKIEYSILLSKIVDTKGSTEMEFDILAENSPLLHFHSEDINTIYKWKSAIFEDYNFDYLRPKTPTMNDFKPFKMIGEGFSGKVHLVRRKTDGRLIALKLISKDKLDSAASVQRMITERNILVQNKYPFITRIYAAFQTESYLILALEYVGGGNLQHHLDKGIKLTQKQIKIYLAQIILALEHLHNMGIVFRDLKPSNILIAKDGNLKLTDFGLSKNIIETGTTRTLCGTHNFLSPEMIMEQPYGFSVDWWALGVVAFRLICGYLPFNNPNLAKLYDRIISCSYRFPVKIDPVAKDLISGLLKKNPEERLTVDQIKNHEFFNGIDWQKVYRKEYKMDFKPYKAEDESAFNFDTNLFEKYNVQSFENDYETSNYFVHSSSNANLQSYENDKSFIKDFSFSSTTEDFDDDDDDI